MRSLAAALLADRISADTTVVLDLFGNTSTKFRQEDDTLALAIKNGGGRGWHMLGEIVYTPDSFISEQVGTLQAVLDSVKNNNKIFLPPIPCFAFGG